MIVVKMMGLFKDCGCGCGGKKQEQKLMISVMSALLFYIVANPQTFKVVRRLVGGWVSSPTGCPTGNGLVLHAVVFLLVTWGLMNVNIKEFNMGADAHAGAPADADDIAAIMKVPEDKPTVVERPSSEDVTVCNCEDGTEILHLK